MQAAFIRDAAMTAVVLGFFASSWFGWAQEAPPVAWRRWLGVAAVGSLLVAAAGGVVAWRHWSSGTVFDDATGRAFGVVVGIEFGAAAIGALVLVVTKRSEWIPVWVAFVVGGTPVPGRGNPRLPGGPATAGRAPRAGPAASLRHGRPRAAW